ncbi:MAG: phage head closure protein [Lentilitoribacter sp.]
MELQFFDPGLLRTPIQLQTCELHPDGQGGGEHVWSSTAEIFAHVEPISSTARERAHYDDQIITHRIIMRYREDITLDHRFLRNTRAFAIRSFHDLDETKRYLVCKCEEMPT